jgi:hypothetical protein
MFHPITQRRWVPLALVAMLCGVVALVSPSAVGAQEAPAFEVSLTGNCAATVADTFTYTLTVTNNGADPIDVVALDQSFTVAAGATGTAEFLEDDVSSGLVNSITIDGISVPRGLSSSLLHVWRWTPRHPRASSRRRPAMNRPRPATTPSRSRCHCHPISPAESVSSARHRG